MAAEFSAADLAALEGASSVHRTKIPGTDTPVLPIAITLAGAWLAWFGVHYWRSNVKWPTDPLKAVLTGQPMPDNSPSDPIAGLREIPGAATAINAPGGGALGGRISAAALRYKGAGYNFGGNADQVGNWDCSSFVSKVLGQDMGLTLPGGGRWGDPGYPPHSHGPGSTQYMLYGVGVQLADVQPGDLIVSVEHIGIALSGVQMISAMDPQRGTDIGDFPAGFPMGPPVYRRVIGIPNPLFQTSGPPFQTIGPPIPAGGTAPPGGGRPVL